MLFKDFVGVVRFGTLLNVAEDFRNKEHFNRVWNHSDVSSVAFSKNVLNADVTVVSVDGNTLAVKIISQD